MKFASMLAACGSFTALAKVLGLVLVSTSHALAGQEAFKLHPSDAETLDLFGYSVAVDGSTAVVGSWLDDDNGSASGSAYLYDVTTGQQVLKLLPNDGATYDFFGISVAVSAGTVIVGASEDDDNGSASGSAYLFDATTGQQMAKLLPSDGSAGDLFGRSVAISGGIAVVGAYDDDDNGQNSGSAYLFDVTTGQQVAKLLASDGSPGDNFGVSVAISGGTAIVGANKDAAGGSQSGSAYLFDVATGQQIAKLLPSDGSDGDFFGRSVAVSGGTALVGAYFDDDNGSDSGSAYLFDVATGQQTAKLLPSDGAPDDYFGYSVAASGNTAIVGVYQDDDNGYNSGSAYLFDMTTGQQVSKLLPSDGVPSDHFGVSVAISGGSVIAGAYMDDDNGTSSGSAYLFGDTVATQWVVSPTNGHWYHLIDSQSWGAAQAMAQTWGGSLATVRDPVENTWLLNIFASAGDLWIGYTDQAAEGVYEWISGEPAGYENWASGEPDDGSGADWAVLQTGSGLWTDEPQLPGHLAVVEVISDDCDADGSPDAYQIAQEPWLDWDGDGVLDDCASANYCTAAVNSSGLSAEISAVGTPIIADNLFLLRASDLPLNEYGYFLMSESKAFIQGFGGSAGNLCLGTPQIRIYEPLQGGQLLDSGSAGTVSFALNLNALPQAAVLQPGDTWHFQLWFRDGFTSNTTDGIEVMFR